MTEAEIENPSKSYLFGIEKIFQKMRRVSQSSVKQSDPLTEAIREQQGQASEFLENNFHHQYVKMINSGYQPTTEQETFFKDYLHNLFISRTVYEPGSGSFITKDAPSFSTLAGKMEGLVTAGFKITAYEANLFFSSEGLHDHLSTINSGEIRFIDHMKQVWFDSSFPNLKVALKEVFQQPTYSADSLKLLNFFTDTLAETNNKSAKDMKNKEAYHTNKITYRMAWLLQSLPKAIFHNTSMEDFNNFVIKTNRFLGDEGNSYIIKDEFQKIASIIYSADYDEKINKTKEVYSSNYFKNLTLEASEQSIKSFDFTSLPAQAQTILSEIYQLGQKLPNYSLNQDQKFDFTNITQKRVPEVLKKYLNIDPEYRTTLTNSEGKNAQDLMIESLGNYQSKLQNIIQGINEDKLQDLSATKRYSKSI